MAEGKAHEASAFVDVRFGQITEARIDLQPLSAVPLAALPVAGSGPQRKPWKRPAALVGLGLGVTSAVIAIAFHAKAYATAGDLNRRESLNQLQPGDAAAYRDVDHDTNIARGLYITSAILTAAGAGLFYWDYRDNGFRF